MARRRTLDWTKVFAYVKAGHTCEATAIYFRCSNKMVGCIVAYTNQTLPEGERIDLSRRMIAKRPQVHVSPRSVYQYIKAGHTAVQARDHFGVVLSTIYRHLRTMTAELCAMPKPVDPVDVMNYLATGKTTRQAAVKFERQEDQIRKLRRKILTQEETSFIPLSC